MPNIDTTIPPATTQSNLDADEIMGLVAAKLNVPATTFDNVDVSGSGWAGDNAEDAELDPFDAASSAPDVPTGAAPPTAPPVGATLTDAVEQAVIFPAEALDALLDDEPLDPDAEYRIIPPGEDDDVDADATAPIDTVTPDPNLDPAPDAPAPTAGVLDRYFQQAYGAEPNVETIQAIEQSLTYVESLSRLHPNQQDMISRIVAGTFNPADYAPAPAPTTAPTPAPAPVEQRFDEWGYPIESAPAPAPTAADPRVEAMSARLARMEEQQLAQRQRDYAAYQANIQQGIVTGRDEFTAAHPELDGVDVMALMKRVNQSGAYTTEIERGEHASVAYRRQMEAHLLSDPHLASKRGVAVSAVAVNAAVPPVDDAETIPRQARSAAIAGSSTPSSTRRRSALDNGTGSDSPPPARSRGDLQAQILASLTGTD